MNFGMGLFEGAYLEGGLIGGGGLFEDLRYVKGIGNQFIFFRNKASHCCPIRVKYTIAFVRCVVEAIVYSPKSRRCKKLWCCLVFNLFFLLIFLLVCCKQGLVAEAEAVLSFIIF